MTNPILPEWYGKNITLPTETGKRGHSGTHIRRALGSLAQALSEELASSDATRSWLGKIEPRAKLVAFLLLVIGTTLLQRLLPLAVMLMSLVALALWSGVDIKRLARIWAGVPVFSLAFIIPAALNLITPGRPALILWHGGHELSITWSGLEVASRFLLRTMNGVTLTMMMVSTTEHSALLNGLRRLGMPKVFGMVLAMMQRYLVLMLRAAEEIHLAKLSRTIDAGPTNEERRWAAAGMGILFRRTHRLAQEVNNAMISRGYDGEVHLPRVSHLRGSDYAAVAVSAVLMVALVLADRLI